MKLLTIGTDKDFNSLASISLVKEMKKTRILFVCKYNRFRSRVATAYFNKINKNKKIVATGAGVLQGYLPLDKTQVKVSKQFGFSILGKPRTMGMDMLNQQDIIVNVANDVPESVFIPPKNQEKRYTYWKKVVHWKIPDVSEGKSVEQNTRVIKAIMKKVEELNRKLARK